MGYKILNDAQCKYPFAHFIKRKGVELVEKRNLALSYFPRELPPKYLRRDSVSQSSSGWNRSGPTALLAPGMLVRVLFPQDCINLDDDDIALKLNQLSIIRAIIVDRKLKVKPSVC